MKTNATFSIDPDVRARAKANFENVSLEVETFLREALDLGEIPEKENQLIHARQKIVSLSVALSKMTTERDRILKENTALNDRINRLETRLFKTEGGFTEVRTE